MSSLPSIYSGSLSPTLKTGPPHPQRRGWGGPPCTSRGTSLVRNGRASAAHQRHRAPWHRPARSGETIASSACREATASDPPHGSGSRSPATGEPRCPRRAQGGGLRPGSRGARSQGQGVAMSESTVPPAEGGEFMAAASDGVVHAACRGLRRSDTAWDAYEPEGGRGRTHRRDRGCRRRQARADGKLEIQKATDHSTRSGLKWGLVGGVALGVIFPPSISAARQPWARPGRPPARRVSCTTAPSSPMSWSTRSRRGTRESLRWSPIPVRWRSARRSRGRGHRRVGDRRRRGPGHQGRREGSRGGRFLVADGTLAWPDPRARPGPCRRLRPRSPGAGQPSPWRCWRSARPSSRPTAPASARVRPARRAREPSRRRSRSPRRRRPLRRSPHPTGRLPRWSRRPSGTG